MKSFILSRAIVLSVLSVCTLPLHANDALNDHAADASTFDGSIKVAFTGDQGVENSAVAVLELIRDEGAELLLIQGDFGYDDNTAHQWEDNLNQVLGENFPVLSVVGNHEDYEWPIYAEFIKNRVDRVSEIRCSGNVGVKSDCRYKGLQIVQTAPGISNIDGIDGQDDYSAYIKDAFDNHDAQWRICSWHKNQTKMQTGTKPDDVGWGPYQSCLNAGAIVATGHEHAYSRTYLMDSFESQSVKHTENEMRIEPGQSIAFVSGLGGREVRKQVRDDAWWASIYTDNQGATHGALFCTFERESAQCYFKDIAGGVPDKFTLLAGNRGSEASVLDDQSDAESELADANGNAAANNNETPSDGAAPNDNHVDSSENAVPNDNAAPAADAAPNPDAANPSSNEQSVDITEVVSAENEAASTGESAATTQNSGGGSLVYLLLGLVTHWFLRRRWLPR